MRVLLLSTPHPLEESPLPPLSLSYLAGVLAQEGIEVKILDFLVTHYHPKKLRRELEDYQPRLVGATCVTLNYPIARRMLRKGFQPATTVEAKTHVESRKVAANERSVSPAAITNTSGTARIIRMGKLLKTVV